MLAPADIYTSLEYRNHAVSILLQEFSRLEDSLIVLTSSRYDSRIDNPEHGEHKLVVLPQSLGVIEFEPNVGVDGEYLRVADREKEASVEDVCGAKTTLADAKKECEAGVVV
jgi:hypothetical protein